MTNRKRRNACFPLFALLLALCPPAALADNYPRQTGIDVQHYVLRVALSDESDEIAGHATITVRFLKDGLSEFWLDLASSQGAKGMTVSGVSIGDISLRYTHLLDRLTIKLQAPSKTGDIRQYDVQYHGVPAGASATPSAWSNMMANFTSRILSCAMSSNQPVQLS